MRRGRATPPRARQSVGPQTGLLLTRNAPQHIVGGTEPEVGARANAAPAVAEVDRHALGLVPLDGAQELSGGLPEGGGRADGRARKAVCSEVARRWRARIPMFSCATWQSAVLNDRQGGHMLDQLFAPLTSLAELVLRLALRLGLL